MQFGGGLIEGAREGTGKAEAQCDDVAVGRVESGNGGTEGQWECEIALPRREEVGGGIEREGSVFGVGRGAGENALGEFAAELKGEVGGEALVFRGVEFVEGRREEGAGCEVQGAQFGGRAVEQSAIDALLKSDQERGQEGIEEAALEEECPAQGGFDFIKAGGGGSGAREAGALAVSAVLEEVEGGQQGKFVIFGRRRQGVDGGDPGACGSDGLD